MSDTKSFTITPQSSAVRKMLCHDGESVARKDWCPAGGKKAAQLAEPCSDMRVSLLSASLLGFGRRESQRGLELSGKGEKGQGTPELLSSGLTHFRERTVPGSKLGSWRDFRDRPRVQW